MDLGIKELGITFLVGAFTILGLELILYHYFGIQLTGFFHGRLGLFEAESVDKHNHVKPSVDPENKAESKELTMRTAVFIGLAFAIGILAEDISSKYKDNLFIPFKGVSENILPDRLVDALDLPVKYDSRFKTLLYLDTDQKLTPNKLAQDLAVTESFSLVDPDNGKKVEGWINPKDGSRCTPAVEGTATCPSMEELTSTIHRLYYYAKNNSYGNENYYDEMKRIQTRLDFSRSISMIALIYFCIAIFLLLPLVVRPLSRLVRKLTWVDRWVLRVNARLSALVPMMDNPSPPTDRHDVNSRQRIPLMFKVPVILVMLFLVYFVGGRAYAREAEEFNKRAFGYFSSTRISAKKP